MNKDINIKSKGRNYMFLFSLFAFMMVSLPSFGQDDCSTATSIGTLPDPDGCNGANTGDGTPVVTSGTNVGATAETPYTTLTNCQGSGTDMDSPADDVWFTFVASANELDIDVTGAIADPNIAIWEGTCAALIGRGCNVGSGGNVSMTVNSLTPGTTYYIQVSGGTVGDQGAFDLTLTNYNDCSACMQANSLTVTPAPVNGTYQAGEVVDFCYTIDEYTQVSSNWLLGVAFQFGAGWDTSTITPVGTPTTSSTGTWIWTCGGVTSSATGLTVNDCGWYFDRDGNGNPGDNFGDGGNGQQGPWTFCFQITTSPTGTCSEGADLSVTVDNYADGELGSWTSIACQNDPSYVSSASLTCCPLPTITSNDVTCFGDSDGSITATGLGASPWDYVWTNSGGGTIQTSNNINGSDTVTGLAPDTYTVEVTDDNGCTTSVDVVITSPVILAVPTITSVAPTCAADGTSTITNFDGTLTYVFTPAGPTVGAGGLISGMTLGTSYTVIGDNGSCQSTASAAFSNAAMLITPATPTITSVAPTCVADGTSTVSNYDGTLTYTFTPAGPTVGAGGAISGMTLGTSYTITAANTDCTSTASVSFSNAAQLSVPAVPTITSVAPTCAADGTSTITNYDGTLTYVFTPAGPTVGAGGLISGMTLGTSYTVIGDNGSCQSTASAAFSNAAMLSTSGTPIANVTEQPSCTNIFGTITVTSPTLAANEEYVLDGPDATGTIQTNSTDGIFTSLTSGDYTLYISNTVTGCVSSSIMLTLDAVTVIPSFVLNNGCNGVDYTISVDDPDSSYTYNWYDSTGTLIGSGDYIIVTQADTYEVQATLGTCTATEYITINNAFCSIPKGLSPNGDGLNDTWELSNLDVKQVKIYNRYGTEVYSKSNYTNEWDGTSNKGNELPDATYYYVIWFNNDKTTTGWVYINR
jgi:gliding motility-associated-like protein